MEYEFGGKSYSIVLGSDIVADGMFLEAREVGKGGIILFAFWSDADGSFTFSAYEQDLPFALVEAFLRDARKLLPPVDSDGVE